MIALFWASVPPLRNDHILGSESLLSEGVWGRGQVCVHVCVGACVRMRTCVLGRGRGLRRVCPAWKQPSLSLSMEVGVCVEAYRQGAETQRRHINSAFMTFVVLDADDQPRTLPWIRPQPGVSGTLPRHQLPSLSAQEWGWCGSDGLSPAPLLGHSQL